jgi:hypothetical protein
MNRINEKKKRDSKELTNYQLKIVITILDIIDNNMISDDIINDYILDVNSLNLSMDCVDKADLGLAINKLKKQIK